MKWRSAVFTVVRKVYRRVCSIAFYLRYTHTASFRTRPVIDGLLPKLCCHGAIRFGRSCTLRSFRTRQHISAFEGAVIELGDRVYLNDGVNICATKKITVGSDSKIGDMVYILDSDFHGVSLGEPTKTQDVSLGKNVWVGARSIILAGSSIGDHSVIGAGSVVAGNIPAKSIAVGNPARMIRSFECEDDWIRV